jgi:hypothetical protein
MVVAFLAALFGSIAGSNDGPATCAIATAVVASTTAPIAPTTPHHLRLAENVTHANEKSPALAGLFDGRGAEI